MSINVAIVGCLCKQSLDICPKKPQSICTLVTRGTLFCCQMWIHLFLSAQPANMWPLSGIFLPAHCLSFSNRGSEICRPDFIWRARERGEVFSGFYNPHSASVKSFVMKQTKARSWSGIHKTQESTHNLHSVYSSNRHIFTLKGREFWVHDLLKALILLFCISFH